MPGEIIHSLEDDQTCCYEETTWGWINGLPQVSPQFYWEEAIHWDDGQFGCLVDVLPQTPARVHPAREAEGHLSDVFREHRDDWDASSNGHCSKALPENFSKIEHKKQRFHLDPHRIG